MIRAVAVSLVVVFCSLSACKTAEPKREPVAPLDPTPAEVKEAGPIHLTIVGTNDLHGWLMAIAEGGVKAGGLAALAGYVKILREENPGGVLLLDAGDLFQGTLASNLSEGEAVIAAMNAVGFDAAAIGNHEFDFGPVGPHVTAQDGEDVFGVLKARMAQAKFPMLSANIYEHDSKARPEWLPGDGTAIFERHGVKIGVIGLTTPQTPQTTLPINVASLRFAPLAPEALTAANRLREKGAQVVIAVMHAGGKCARWDDAKDTSSCDTSQAEVFTMLSALPPGTLDAVVAGHVHNIVGHVFAGTPVIETYSMDKSFGTIDLYLDPISHAVLADHTEIKPVQPICELVDQESKSCDPKALKGKLVQATVAEFHGKPIVPDQKVANLVAPALDKVTELQHKPLGLKVPKGLGRNYEAESALGSFLADSLRGMEKADVALVNPGGLRADLKAGDLTYGAVFEVIPFDNAIATLDLSGEELTRLLKAAYAGRKGVFQIAGLQTKISRCVTLDRLKSVTLDSGKPIDPAARYRVVMPDFLARGGDGLAGVLTTIEPAHIDLGQNRELGFRDALIAFWQQSKKPLEAPKLGRITQLAEKAPCPAVETGDRGQ
ncbi:MAG: bifunctional metallophosphatase/5'-nucleotidase [Archangiaceae bacterium]|nr:bifunctional metallophosphatase/5'-nucleotidase [Archangiaceae bacterium]